MKLCLWLVAAALPSTLPTTVMLMSPASNCSAVMFPVCAAVAPATGGDANWLEA